MLVDNVYTHKNSPHTSLLEMAEVGRFSSYRVSIYGGEGPIPHFHFYNKDPNRGGCIRLDKPEYFVHGNHNEKLSSKERKNMIEWLQSPHKSFGKYGLTNWHVICIYWDDNNQDYLFDKDAEMPDYILLR